MELIHKKSTKITSGQCEPSGQLSLIHLLDMLQTAAGEHADILHFGIKDLNKGNDTWVLSRLRVEIPHWPQKGDTVTLKTWPKGVDRLFAIRDFILSGSSGIILARAASYWLIVDRVTKRPKIPGNVFRDPIYPDLSAIDDKIDKIPALQDILYRSTVKTTEKEVDINGHINNVWYAKWFIESLPDTTKKENSISSFEINYLSEVFANETLDIETGMRTTTGKQLFGSIKRAGNEVCRTKITFY